MEQSGGGGGELAEPSDAGADRLSGLPDDALVFILVRLDTAADAARTSVLSHRWRRVWTLLPELRFAFRDPLHIASALAAHEAALRYLLVCTLDAASEPVAAWLRVTAPRLSGRLIFINWVPGAGTGSDDDEDSEETGAFELPCLKDATAVKLDLGHSIGVAMPMAGVFSRLIYVFLSRLRFHGLCNLGDAVSSRRCPCFQKLSVRYVLRGLFKLSVHSDSHSLLQLDLREVIGLQELAIDAPALEELKLVNCLVENQPIVNISAPELISLNWKDAYDPSSMQLGGMEQLQQLFSKGLIVHRNGHHDSFSRKNNRNCQRLLQQFQVVHTLSISLVYLQDLSRFPYLEDITFLPRCVVLTIWLVNHGHAIGSGLYHLLRLCAGIKSLFVILDGNLEAQSLCPLGCICDQPIDWKTEKLQLNCLQEVDITNLTESEYEVAFVKQLFNWSTVLKSMRTTFDYSVCKRTALKLFDAFSGLSMPETCIQVYIWCDPGKQSICRHHAVILRHSSTLSYCCC